MMTCGSEAEMRGKVCLITGATSGIGRATALQLGAMGANLILVGRNELRGLSVADALRSKTRPVKVDFVRCDLSLQSDVRALADAVRRHYQMLDVLINNAGARFDTYGKTSEGLEETFATNHLGHFLLTCLLLDRLAAAPSARILTVSSSSHAAASLNGDWQFAEDNYDRRMAYAKSKLANILFTFELASRLSSTNVTSNAVDPGGVASNFARNNGLLSWFRHLAAHSLQRELISPSKAAETICYLVSSAEVTGISGRYFRGKQVTPPAPSASNCDAARQLWSLSLQLTGLNAHMVPAWRFIRPDAIAC